MAITNKQSNNLRIRTYTKYTLGKIQRILNPYQIDKKTEDALAKYEQDKVLENKKSICSMVYRYW